MPIDLIQFRKQMAAKARHKDSRINSFSRDLPCDWGPDKITNPKIGFPFNDESAWHLIADILDSDHEVFLFELDKPPGKQALEILYDFDEGQSFLYIKVHMGAKDKVFGRSFHLSTRGRLRRGEE